MELKVNSEISVPNQPNPIQQDVALGQKYPCDVAAILRSLAQFASKLFFFI